MTTDFPITDSIQEAYAQSRSFLDTIEGEGKTEGETAVPLSKPQGKEEESIKEEQKEQKESPKEEPPKMTKKSSKTPPETTKNLPIEPTPQFKFKQVILVRTDIKLSPGKLAAQVAHASVNAFNTSPPLTRQAWITEGHQKIVLQVADDIALTHFYTQAKALGLPASIITDFGLTELPPNTTTTVAIGPAPNEAINTLTKDLRLY